MTLVHVIAIVVVLAIASGTRVTLNVPQVLLPLVPSSGVRANFTLTADKGCFVWTSTKPHIASVHPQYGEGGCSRAAVVTPQSTSTSRSNTVVLAEEQDTGLELRCDVFVDTIHRIEIVTTTRELLLDEAPEVFDVRAFDEEGNMFSSCRGHLFDWSLSSAGEQQPEEVISFVPFSESSYKTDDIIKSLESKGYHGDSILVSGIGTGVAVVNVKLMESLWKAITEHDDVTATSVDTASVRELQARNVQDYVATLSNEQCHRLIVEAYSHNGGLELAKALLSAEPPPPNQPENSAIPWCICGKCRTMTTDAEKKCCRQRKCITLDPSFHSLVLDREALAVAIVHRSDFFAGVPVYTPESYRKAAYRQYIIWRYHRLGRGNRRVVPSCVVWAVRDKYPAADGNYLGFKEF